MLNTSFCDRCGASTMESLWAFIRNIKSPADVSKRERPSATMKISTEDFLTLHRNGLNDREIARRLNVKPSSISLLRRKLGLPANAPRGFPKHIIEARKRQWEMNVKELESTLERKGYIQREDLPYSEYAITKLLRRVNSRIGIIKFNVRRGSKFSEYDLFGELAGKRLLYLRGDNRVINFLAQNLNPKNREIRKALTLKLKNSGMSDEDVKQIIHMARSLHTIGTEQNTNQRLS
ncbi:hypothetical protein KEJ51_00195 [Candidatus Bathyarchaeota archaeon]|nr:hypothetical protein [Candidatus Bathyarchaeota archaeon]MBS7628543.1 hypothetical protein [Candidatus Bathyarchaeota archaeon]